MMTRRSPFFLPLLLIVVGCESKAVAPPKDIAVPAVGQQSFRDVTRERGIDYVHDNGATGRRYIVEIVSGGVGFIDYDSDGDYDLYFVDGCPLGRPVDRPHGNRLYRNDGRGSFSDVTAAAGVGDRGFGMGLAVGDVDNDGDSDLYVTNFGANVLYLNQNDGTFRAAPAAGGAQDEGVSTSASLLDYDRDGFLDLYVAAYLKFTLEHHRPCDIHGIEVYCSPAAFAATSNHLFRGTASGFVDVSSFALSGIEPGKGLGVASADVNGDGWPDIYVANDGTANHLLINTWFEGQRRFVDEALFYGAAFGETGKPEAGMGTDFGDVDADGDLDITVTNLEAQSMSLYLNEGGEGALESSFAYGLGAPTLPYVGFGVRFVDFDADMDLDLLVTNGHIIDNIAQVRPGSRFEQPDQLFEQRGDKFVEVLQQDQHPNLPLRAGRGLATADIDNDGDLDAIISNNGAPPTLLENIARRQGVTVGLRLVGKPPRSNRDAYGARVSGEIAGRKIVREVASAASYLAANDPRLLMSAPSGTVSINLTIRWPSGDSESITVRPGAYHTVQEGDGVVSKTDFRP